MAWACPFDLPRSRRDLGYISARSHHGVRDLRDGIERLLDLPLHADPADSLEAAKLPPEQTAEDDAYRDAGAHADDECDAPVLECTVAAAG